MMIQNYLWVHFVSNYKDTASIAIELNMTFFHNKIKEFHNNLLQRLQ